MPAARLTISLDPTTATEVRAAAHQSGHSLSAWIAEAVAEKLRAHSLDEFLNDWEAKHGKFTDEELASAREELGLQR